MLPVMFWGSTTQTTKSQVSWLSSPSWTLAVVTGTTFHTLMWIDSHRTASFSWSDRMSGRVFASCAGAWWGAASRRTCRRRGSTRTASGRPRCPRSGPVRTGSGSGWSRRPKGRWRLKRIANCSSWSHRIIGILRDGQSLHKLKIEHHWAHLH